MAYVQEHKLGLNMWQLRFFLNHLWGVGETFAEYLASNRGNIQGWALVLLYVDPLSILTVYVSSPLPATSKNGYRCYVGLWAVQLMLRVIFVAGHRFPTLCISS